MDNDTRDLRKSISELSSQLKILNDEKENQYKIISKINDELNVLLKQANDLKKQRELLSKEVQEKKKNRDALNKQVSELAMKIKGLKSVHSRLPKEHIPSKLIKEQLDKLNMQIQTEVFSFKKEQKLMEVIKELKLKLKTALAEENKVNEFINSRRKLRDIKLTADISHKAVQAVASKNVKIFKDLSAVSKRIAELKSKREELKKRVSELKIKIHIMNQGLASKLSSWSEIRKIAVVSKQNDVDKIINQKIEAAKEKLAKKEKLTTEDILAMQRQIE